MVHNLIQIKLFNLNIIFSSTPSGSFGFREQRFASLRLDAGWCLWTSDEPQASKHECYLCYVAPCVLLKKAAVLVMQCPQVNATKLGKNRSESTLIPQWCLRWGYRMLAVLQELLDGSKQKHSLDRHTTTSVLK